MPIEPPRRCRARQHVRDRRPAVERAVDPRILRQVAEAALAHDLARASARRSPPSTLKKLVLPAPLRPTRPTLSRGMTVKEACSTTSLPPISTETSCTCNMAVQGGGRSPVRQPGRPLLASPRRREGVASGRLNVAANATQVASWNVETSPVRSLWSRAAPLACGCALAAAALAVAVVDPAGPGSPFPPCPLRALTGWWCPGCGLTRGVHALLRGRPLAMLGFNLLTPLVVVAVVTAWWAWLRAAWGHPTRALPTRVPAWFGSASLIAVVAFALLRNVPALRVLAP